MSDSRHLPLYRESFDPFFTRKFYEQDLEKKEDTLESTATLWTALMDARRKVAEDAASEAYEETPKSTKANHHASFKSHYVNYFLHCYTKSLGIKQKGSFVFHHEEANVPDFFSACLKKLSPAFTLKNILAQLLTLGLQHSQVQLKNLLGIYLDEAFPFSDFLKGEKTPEVLKVLLIHCLFQGGYLNQEKRAEILLSGGDALYLLYGENADLSYVKDKTGEYFSFSTYYEKLTPSQQEVVRSKLVEKANESSYQAEVDAILLLGKRTDFIVQKKGDFHVAFIKAGMMSPTQVEDNGKTPMLMGAALGYFNLVTYLGEKFERLAEVDKKNWGPLHYAAANGHLDCVTYLAEKCEILLNKEDNEKHFTPLVFAVKEKRADVVKYLLTFHQAKYKTWRTNGPYIDMMLDEALRMALHTQQFDLVELLLAAGASVTSDMTIMPIIQSTTFYKEKFTALSKIPSYGWGNCEKGLYPDAYFEGLRERTLDLYSTENCSDAVKLSRVELQQELNELQQLHNAIMHFEKKLRVIPVLDKQNCSAWSDDIELLQRQITFINQIVYGSFQQEKSANKAIKLFIEHCYNGLSQLRITAPPVLFGKQAPTPKACIKEILLEIEKNALPNNEDKQERSRRDGYLRVPSS